VSASACALCVGMALSATPSGASTTAPGIRASAAASHGHTLLQSRELWATVDVCNPSNQPDTVGVRGSMPGDGHAQDKMYMRFQLQYLEAKTNTWVDLHGGDSGFVSIGSAKDARQGGWSVQLKPTAGQPAYTIRGLVTFQWRRGSRIVHETTRMTGAGHQSLADADPPGYSAAQCVIS
jgi:hypothetical protein